MQQTEGLGQGKGGVLKFVGRSVDLVADGAAEVRPAQVTVEKFGAVQPAVPKIVFDKLGFAERAADQVRAGEGEFAEVDFEKPLYFSRQPFIASSGSANIPAGSSRAQSTPTRAQSVRTARLTVECSVSGSETRQPVQRQRAGCRLR